MWRDTWDGQNGYSRYADTSRLRHIKSFTDTYPYRK